MIFERGKKLTTNPATRPFWVFAGSGLDVGRRRQKCSKIYASITNRVN